MCNTSEFNGKIRLIKFYNLCKKLQTTTLLGIKRDKFAFYGNAQLLNYLLLALNGTLVLIIKN